MTDDEGTFDELHQKLTDAISNRIAAPADVVPPDPARAARHRDLLREHAGQRVRLSIPGDIVYDADGIPAGMTATTTCYVRLPTAI